MTTTRPKARTRPVPEWAQDLIERVCADYGRRPPRVTWWQREDWCASGRTYKNEGRIHITAGTSITDTHLVVLHELAHHIAYPKWHHNRRYWELAWEIYGQYEADIDWAMYREATYVAKSMHYCPFVLT